MMKYLFLFFASLFDYYLVFSWYGVSLFFILIFFVLIENRESLSYDDIPSQGNVFGASIVSLPLVLMLFLIGFIYDILGERFLGTMAIFNLLFLFMADYVVVRYFARKKKEWMLCVIAFAGVSFLWLFGFIVVDVIGNGDIFFYENKWILFFSWFRMNLVFWLIYIILYRKKLLYG